ncbi:MAG: hypothetical protein ABJA34_03375 [Pseudonocardiales bacterium]
MALAVSVTLGVAACGGGGAASKSDVVAKLKTESQTKSLTDKQLNCLADILIKHGNKADVKKYADGKKKLDDVRQANGDKKTIAAESVACVNP